MTRRYEYEKIDSEILYYLGQKGECKTREILNHLRDEFGTFARSTLVNHLAALSVEGKVNERMASGPLAYWSLPKKKEKNHANKTD